MTGDAEGRGSLWLFFDGQDLTNHEAERRPVRSIGISTLERPTQFYEGLLLAAQELPQSLSIFHKFPLVLRLQFAI